MSDLPTIPITLPQNVWQRVEDLIGAAITADPDDTDLIRAFWAIRGDDDEPDHIEYPDSTCSDGCVALHPDHAGSRGEE